MDFCSAIFDWNKIKHADVVELVDSVDLGSSVFDVQVRVLSSAPEKAEIVIQSQPFQLNPPLRAGEILLRNVKFSLRSSEIAAAVGGFNFIQVNDLDFISASWFHPCLSKDFIKNQKLWYNS